MIVQDILDYAKSVKLLQPKLSPADQAIFAHQLKAGQSVAQAVQRELARLGLSGEGRQQFFQLLWAAAMDPRLQAERDRLQSWHLLALMRQFSAARSFTVDHHLCVATPGGGERPRLIPLNQDRDLRLSAI